MKYLLELFKDKNCNYGKCRELIEEIGGCTQIIEGEFGIQTTPLHEAIDHGHYDFALELILDYPNYQVPAYIKDGLSWLNGQSIIS